MNSINIINPSNPPKTIDLTDDILVIRERILQSILLVTFGFGLFLLLLSLFTGSLYAIPGNPLSLAIVLGLLAILLVLREIQFSIKAGLFTGMVFVLALISLVSGGIENNGFIFFMAYALLISLFFRIKSGIISIMITALSAAVIGYLMSNGVIPLPQMPAPPASSDMRSWVSIILLYLYLASISTISLIYLVSYLRKSSSEARETSQALQSERQIMEELIEEKTGQVEKRLIEARTIAEISRAISSILDEDALLRQVVTLVQERLGMYYVGLFTVDEFEVNAVLRAGSGEAGEKMLAAKHQLAIGGSSMIGNAIMTRTARIALDVAQERVRFNNPILPHTRSELALPIIIRDQAIGAMTIQSTLPGAFDEDDILIFKGIMDSLAVAIENARLFRRSNENLDEIRSLNRQFIQSNWFGTGNSSHRSAEIAMSENTADESASSVINIPIHLRDQTIGMLELELDRASLTPDEQRLIEAITTQTALALENARLIDESQQRARREERLNQISVNMTRAANIDDLLRTTIQELSQLPSVNEVAIHLVDES